MDSKNVSSWLDKLQQESWNLELLISGFSIFLLLQVGEPVSRLSNHFYELIETHWEAGMLAIFLSILKAASYVMIANRLDADQLIQTATIPSQIIRTNLFPLFIRYHPKDNQAIAALCTDYSPSKTQAFISGIRVSSNGSIYLGSPTIPEESPKKLLNCLSQFYRIYVDTIPLETQRFYFDQHDGNGEKGLSTMIRLDSFPPGAHYLNINTKHLVADTIQERRYARIPFWKE